MSELWARRVSIAVCLALGTAFSSAGSPPPGDAAWARSSAWLGTAEADRAEVVSATARYIVELEDPPLAAYRGGQPGIEATSPAAAEPMLGPDAAAEDRQRRRLDLTTADAVRYAAHLDARQDDLLAEIQRLAPGATTTNRYTVAFNGLAVRLTPSEAEAVAQRPGVIAVTRETPFEPLMDASLPIIGADALWADPRIGGRADMGRGTRIAIIDSGITAEHPMFDDTGFTAPPGFPKATLALGDTVLDYSAEDVARFTNAKVIVARAFVNPELVDLAEGEDPRLAYTPLADGIGGFHGAHVAGIAAGAVVTGAPGNPGRGTIAFSGVAPGAHVMAYKFTNAYTPEILAMIDTAVADGADVINASWGTAAMNVLRAEHHPVSRAFAAASEAGVVVVAAAGNSGANGEATLGGPHQMIEPVITVANSGTGRRFEYRLTASDEGLTDTLRSHRAVYESFGAEFTVIEKQAYHTDMCNLIELGLRGRTRVLISPFEGACEDSLIPIPLPDGFGWVGKLLNAATVRAESVVFYAAEGDLETLGATLGLVELVAPLLEGFLGEVEFPVTAIIAGDEAAALGAWAVAHPELRLRLDSTPESILDPAAIDAVHPSSSQGPAPVGPLKPDLGAPGTDILSASTGFDGAAAGYQTATGTSMASPHVAGAAAVIRQLHPEWSPADIRSALLTTADPVLTAAGAAAPATVQGAGRLDLAQAADPSLRLDPPSLEIRWLGDGTPRRHVVRVEAIGTEPPDAVEVELAHEPGTGGGLPIVALPASLRLESTAAAAAVGSEAAAGSASTVASEAAAGFAATAGAPAAAEASAAPAGTLELELDLTDLALGDYDGRIVFGSGATAQRVTYRLRVPQPARDVLLVDVRRRSTEGGGLPGLPGIPGLPGLPGGGFEDGPDYVGYWTDALDAIGLDYSVWSVAEGARAGAPPLSELQRYRLVIVAAGDGDAPLDRLPGGMTAFQMYLLQGGRMLVSGHALGHTITNAAGLQSSGSMHFLPRYFAGFERLEDDVEGETVLRPTRLFDGRIELATAASPQAAGNGGTLDLGRPLAGLVTSAAGGGLPPDLGLAAPLAVDRILPYARTFAVAGEGDPSSPEAASRGAMIGVSADASLEHPYLDAGIPWRAMFAGFAIEAIAPAPGALSRAEVIERILEWSIEPEDVSVTLFGPAGDATAPTVGDTISVQAVADSPSGVDIIGWRWDIGDGRPFVTGAGSRVDFDVRRPGEHIVRAEAMTAAAHTVVGELRIVVEGGAIYLPKVAAGP